MAAESMLDAGNVGIGKGRPGGYAVVAPAGTDPAKFADASKTLKEVLAEVTSDKSLGYISEDGVTNSTDTSSDSVKDWGGTVVTEENNEYSESVQVTFLETRESVLKAVFGDANVTVAKGVTTVRHNADFTAPHLFAFDCVISDTKVKRTVIPAGRIFERDDLTQNSSDPIGYTPTIKAMPSAAMDGDVMRDYIYDAAAATQSADGGKAAAVSGE